MRVFRFGSYGLSVGGQGFRVHGERWPGFWHLTGFGVSLWRDTSPEMTVGERGVW